MADRERLLRRATYRRLSKVGGPRPPWEDLVLLITCNRIEVYAVTDAKDSALRTITAVLGLPPEAPSLYVLEGEDAAAHLLRAASGLDSVAEGEEQIAAQVRKAPEARPASWKKSDILGGIFARTAHAAARIRNLAGLDGEPWSASHAAIRLIEDVVSPQRPTVALIGTGKMARIAAEGLRGRADLIWVGRDTQKARSIARSLGGASMGLSGIERVLARADVVLSATASRRHLISLTALRAAVETRRNRPLRLIDLGFPRNIDPRCRELPGVTLVDIDGLAPWGFRPMPPTAQARVEALIRVEAGNLLGILRPESDLDVAEFRKTAERLRRQEVEGALARLPQLTDDQRAVVDKLATRLVNRFLHGPTESLRFLPEETRAQVVRGLVAGLLEKGGRVR